MSGKRNIIRVLVLLLGGFLLAACQSDPVVIPTVAVLPSITPSPVRPPTLPPSWTPTFTYTPSLTPTPTYTATATFTYTPTPTATYTPTFTPSSTFTFTPTNTPRPATRTPYRTPTLAGAVVGGGGGGAAPEPILPPPSWVPSHPVEHRLAGVPVLPGISARTRQIFQHGQTLGRQANVFAKVGDCHTDTDMFMFPLGVGEYDLGGYGHLQRTIDFFTGDSFVTESIAASSAFNAAAVLDSTWSPPETCTPDTSPLICEFNRIQPAVAIILLGSVDIQIYDVAQFRASLQDVVQISINNGVIPVLTTFPSSPIYKYEESLAFNNVILDVAAQHQVPVINLWLASRGLPNLGLREDGWHLSLSASRFLNFAGQEREYGVTLQNLLALQALDILKQGLVG